MPDQGSPDGFALADFAQEVLVEGGATKARIALLTKGGERWLLKDISRQHGLVRILFGRPAMRRERNMLRALDGMDGVPRLRAAIGSDALVMEFVPGEALKPALGEARCRRASLDLAAKVARLHAQGVVHLDLRQRRNILVGADGQVTLVDFESAWRLPTAGWRSVPFRFLKRLDEGAVLKFRAKYAADTLGEAERKRAARAAWLGRLWVFHRFTPLLKLLLGRRETRKKD